MKKEERCTMSSSVSPTEPTSRPGTGDFEQDVHAVARLIPQGRVTSYGAIARYLGAARSSRMVGWAMNRALEQNGFDIPAHRVVNRQGMLTGRMHFPTPETMAERLQQEGIQVRDHQVMDFAERYWDPCTEL